MGTLIIAVFALFSYALARLKCNLLCLHFLYFKDERLTFIKQFVTPGKFHIHTKPKQSIIQPLSHFVG
jgi:hypothetical protein